MRMIIDRFEDDKAVIEHGDMRFNIPVSALPKDAKEGDEIKIGIIKNEDRKDEMKKLMNDIFNK